MCTSCGTDHPIAESGITVSKTSNPANGTVVSAADTITYTLTAVVTDSALTDPLVLTDTLGAGLSFGAVTAAGAYSANVTGAPTLVFTLPAGTVPGSYAVSYTATVDNDATGTVGNVVVATGGTPPGGTPPVCTSCGTEHPLTPVELGIVKTGPAIATVGQQVVFTINVTNTGSTIANDVTVTDPIPAGLTFVSNAGDCTSAFPCSLGTMTAGETRTITVTLMIPVSYSGPEEIINIATVSSSSTSDSHSSTATVPMRRPPPTLIPASSPWALLLMAMALGMLAWHQRGRMY